jgi:hypothetical protein
VAVAGVSFAMEEAARGAELLEIRSGERSDLGDLVEAEDAIIEQFRVVTRFSSARLLIRIPHGRDRIGA